MTDTYNMRLADDIERIFSADGVSEDAYLTIKDISVGSQEVTALIQIQGKLPPMRIPLDELRQRCPVVNARVRSVAGFMMVLDEYKRMVG